MNENNFPVINDSDVGMDPSIVTTIETLDVLPPAASGKKSKEKRQKKKYTTVDPDKKPHDKLKKVIFTVVVLLLMGGVSFGVYYYLSLGQNKKPVNTTQLAIKNVFVGYGLDAVIDMSGYGEDCTLDSSKVNTNEVGVYPYTITCSKTLFEGTINVIEMQKFKYKTNLVYASSFDEITVNDFISSDDSNDNFVFASQEAVEDCFKNPGGICPVEIMVTNVNEVTPKATFAQLVVVENKPRMYMNCTNETDTKQFLFDQNNNDMKNGVIVIKETYSEEEFYFNLSQIIGGTNYNGVEQYHVIYNPSKLEIYFIKRMNYDEMGDIPTTYSELDTYYKNSNHKCSLSFKGGI